MKLRELLKYDEIILQCHNNPDADTICSGYALYRFFNEKGKKVQLIYGGDMKVTKPNLKILIDDLSIPLQHVQSIHTSGILITVDCQYGAGNVKRFDVDNVAIIDHHQQEVTDITLCEIRHYLGSCSTLVWSMLEDEGFRVNDFPDVSTALYYGLLTDSNNFTEIKHPTDRDMLDSLSYDTNLIRKLKNSNLTIKELEIAGVALLRNSYNSSNRFSIIKTHPCDPNILGFISDLAIQVDSIDVCVVYNETDHGIKYSVRSSIKEVMASELADYISDGIGSGGGHSDKGGGFIINREFTLHFPGINTDEYLLTKLTKYFGSFKVIDCFDSSIDITTMERYRKQPLIQGFVKCTDVIKKGTPIIVRTLKCDMDDLVSDDNIYFIIGLKGDVYPVTKDQFEKEYTVLNEHYDLHTEYFPHIRDKNAGHIVNLQPYAKKCISNGEVYVYVTPLEETVKVFTMWDRDTYMLGKPGDYLIVKEDDPRDINIISQDVFNIMYKK